MRKVMSSIVVLLALSIISCNNGEKKEEKAMEESASPKFEVIFFDVNGDSFEPQVGDEVLSEKVMLADLNLSQPGDFWGEKRSFFLQGVGALKIPSDGTYHFRLTSAGKAHLSITNKDMIAHGDMHPKESKTGSRNLKTGIEIFDFSYFPGDNDPFLVLEWSTDGENYEVIPSEAYASAKEGYLEPWSGDDSPEDDSEDNTLTDEEKADGWKLLFDGTTTNGWHTYGKPGTIGSNWTARDGMLVFEGYDRYTYYISGVRFQRGPLDKVALGGLDIVSDEAYENFELMLDWKISEGGNSGIFYTVQEDPAYPEGWYTSPEMQVLDNQAQKDGLIRSHSGGDLYDLIPSEPNMTKKAGEWNRVKIVKNKGKVEHWLNGTMVVSYDMNSTEFLELVSNSKFADKKNFLNPGPGRIGLQDHDDQVFYKNIKIKILE